MRVGHGQAEPGRPRLVRPMIYLNHGPKPDPACDIPIPPTVGQVRSARFHRTGRLPGLACDILRYFSLFWSSSCGSYSKFRGHNVLVNPRPVVSSGSHPSSCPPAAYEAESAMPLRRPSDTVGARGLRSVSVRRISRHDKESRIVTFFSFFFRICEKNMAS